MTRTASWTDRDPVAFHATLRGGQVACVDFRTGERLSYAELDARIARCAGLLRLRLGEPEGQRVASVLRNGLESVLLLFACERVGAIYCPLNWRLSPPELAAIVADCTPHLLIFDPEFQPAVDVARQADPPLTETLDREAFLQAVEAAHPVEAEPAGVHAPAVILYTSGTTGRPKGVVLSRSAIFWGALNFASVADLNSNSAMLCDAPIFHTVGLIATTRGVLQQGGRLLLSDRFTPALANARIADPDLGITHIFGVPQIAQMLREDPSYSAPAFARLRGLFVGGAPLPQSLCEAYLDDGVRIVNGYGMTETSTITGMPLDLAQIRCDPGAAGWPAPATELRLVDAQGRDVVGDGVGEIWVRGPAVSSGYWANPEATAAAFEDGWFKTGDGGRRDAEGRLFIVDRWKDMYISGGENVYPSEVESVIAGLAGVRLVAVVGAPDARWGEVGHAFIEIESGAGLTAAAVLAHCAGRLARYKQPVAVRFLESLPRTGSGKILKAELRRMVSE